MSGVAAKENSFRFSTKRANEASELVLYEYRAYTPSTGRWLSHDPAEDGHGRNPYNALGNDLANFVDVLGLWKSGRWGTQHKDLTIGGLNAALAIIAEKPSETCKTRLRDTLVEANESQDVYGSPAANDMRRHFNRRYEGRETPEQRRVRRNTARDAYLAYTAGEASAFWHNRDCWARLRALGRLSHSWQDFFAHAIHTNGRFVDPVAGSPASPGEFWPSSYNAPNIWSPEGEHPNLREPVEPTSQRYQQAQAFTSFHFEFVLHQWWKRCKCECL